jgi:hypothetical protein
VELLDFIELINCCNPVLLRRHCTRVTLKSFASFWCERWTVALREYLNVEVSKIKVLRKLLAQ